MIYLYLFGTCFHFIYVFMIISNYYISNFPVLHSFCLLHGSFYISALLHKIWNSSKVIDIVYRYESVITSIDCFCFVCPYRSYPCYLNL